MCGSWGGKAVVASDVGLESLVVNVKEKDQRQVSFETGGMVVPGWQGELGGRRERAVTAITVRRGGAERWGLCTPSPPNRAGFGHFGHFSLTSKRVSISAIPCLYHLYREVGSNRIKDPMLCSAPVCLPVDCIGRMCGV